MKKPTNVMSLAMELDMQEVLKQAALKKNISVSKLIRDLVEKYVVREDDFIPVVIKIPVELKGKSEELDQWMEARAKAIVKALS